MLRLTDAKVHSITYKSGGVDLATFDVKESNAQYLADLSEKHKNTILVSDKEGNKRVHTSTDFFKFQRDKFIEHVVGWHDVCGEEQDPKECNDDNKLWFFKRFFDIAIWVNNQVDTLSYKRIEREEELTKNLNSPESGSPEDSSAQ